MLKIGTGPMSGDQVWKIPTIPTSPTGNSCSMTVRNIYIIYYIYIYTLSLYIYIHSIYIYYIYTIYIYIMYVYLIYIYTNWWFQPLWNIYESDWLIIPTIGETKNVPSDRDTWSSMTRLYSSRVACFVGRNGASGNFGDAHLQWSIAKNI